MTNKLMLPAMQEILGRKQRLKIYIFMDYKLVDGVRRGVLVWQTFRDQDKFDSGLENDFVFSKNGRFERDFGARMIHYFLKRYQTGQSDHNLSLNFVTGSERLQKYGTGGNYSLKSVEQWMKDKELLASIARLRHDFGDIDVCSPTSMDNKYLEELQANLKNYQTDHLVYMAVRGAPEKNIWAVAYSWHEAGKPQQDVSLFRAPAGGGSHHAYAVKHLLESFMHKPNLQIVGHGDLTEACARIIEQENPSVQTASLADDLRYLSARHHHGIVTREPSEHDLSYVRLLAPIAQKAVNAKVSRLHHKNDDRIKKVLDKAMTGASDRRGKLMGVFYSSKFINQKPSCK